MVPESLCEGIPVYPNATAENRRSVSLVGGGGGIDSTFASGDTIEMVVAYYEQHFGPGDKESLPGKCRWMFSETKDNWVSTRLLVVEAGLPAGAQASEGVIKSR
ncbi:MAG TPA: hypothetical protein VKD72_20265, partial [Gemmataceae bacterium]|nr:hypothetical protein [Gemmataceae bacterium]